MAFTLENTAEQAKSSIGTNMSRSVFAFAATAAFLFVVQPGMAAALMLTASLCIVSALVNLMAISKDGHGTWRNMTGEAGAMSIAALLWLAIAATSGAGNIALNIAFALACALPLIAVEAFACATLAYTLAETNGRSGPVAVAALVSDRYFGFLGRTA